MAGERWLWKGGVGHGEVERGCSAAVLAMGAERDWNGLWRTVVMAGCLIFSTMLNRRSRGRLLYINFSKDDRENLAMTIDSA